MLLFKVALTCLQTYYKDIIYTRYLIDIYFRWTVKILETTTFKKNKNLESIAKTNVQFYNTFYFYLVNFLSQKWHFKELITLFFIKHLLI